MSFNLVIFSSIAQESHDRLEEQTVDAQNIMTSNIKILKDEKALIRSGHEKLAQMTEDIKLKLGDN